MKLQQTAIVLAVCACIAGCAAPGASSAPDTTLTPTVIATADIARDAIAVGKSTRADVIAALGKTTAIRFDSGFEVWVYHIKSSSSSNAGWLARLVPASAETGTAGKTEFVVLFAPSGLVAKSRLRPAPTPAGSKGQ